jgi:pre-mRNA cleavage complex 2 protein Pcf11
MSIQPQYADNGHQHHHFASQPPQLTQPGYGYTAPRQVQPMDPHTFRQFYSQQLAQLTVNSRPIIQNLSILAQEYSRMAHVVAQCLETHTRLVSIVPFRLYIPD